MIIKETLRGNKLATVFDCETNKREIGLISEYGIWRITGEKVYETITPELVELLKDYTLEDSKEIDTKYYSYYTLQHKTNKKQMQLLFVER